MKYSIIISPKQEKSNAIGHALKLVQVILSQSEHEISVFFYGYAVNSAFKLESEWQQVAHENVSLTACSTIAEKYLSQHLKVSKYFNLTGLGQWMDSVCDADKIIEFK